MSCRCAEAVREAAKAHAPFVAPPPPDWVLLELHLTSVIGVVFAPGPVRWRWAPGSLSTERLGGAMADGVRKEAGDPTLGDRGNNDRGNNDRGNSSGPSAS